MFNKGEKGSRGDKGSQGEKGSQGQKGISGTCDTKVITTLRLPDFHSLVIIAELPRAQRSTMSKKIW